MTRLLALAGLLLLTGCGQAVHFEASDGRRLHGRFTPAAQKRAPGVVLVHGLYGEPSQWKDFAAQLHAAGFATLAYASRSDHEPDPAVLARDVTGAVRFLRHRPEVDPKRIALVGSSVGGETVAYVLGSSELPVLGGVSLSVVRSPRIDALRRRGEFHPHDLLLLSDQREAATARRIRAPGVTLGFTETAGHGTELLTDATIRDRAVAWLERISASRRG